MVNSKQIGALVGPTLIAILVSEFPLVQPKLYDAQTPPVVYLSGVLLFVAGLAIVRVHNVWKRNWTALVTLCGWSSLVLGLVRMFAATAYRHATQSASSTMFMLLEAFLLAIALAITYKSYSNSSS
jgi:multisubunit Na+/H+ antiporter MnhG subunit